MRGVSPMIAVVLLIAFTIAIGGILSVFLTGLTKTHTEVIEEEAEKQIKCGKSILDIKEVTSSLGILDYANLTVLYTYGTENLYNFSIFFVDNLQNSVWIPAAQVNPQYTKASPFIPGMLQTWQINISAVSAALTGSNLDLVRVQAICHDTYVVSAECKAGQACMK